MVVLSFFVALLFQSHPRLQDFFLHDHIGHGQRRRGGDPAGRVDQQEAQKRRRQREDQLDPQNTQAADKGRAEDRWDQGIAQAPQSPGEDFDDGIESLEGQDPFHPGQGQERDGPVRRIQARKAQAEDHEKEGKRPTPSSRHHFVAWRQRVRLPAP